MNQNKSAKGALDDTDAYEIRKDLIENDKVEAIIIQQTMPA